ncbi:MAG TPA: hypothetical protein VHE30_29810 [Polyangiaceae bacterium]|nr:hypothetical protein [Polyangiaceae bacterium]
MSTQEEKTSRARALWSRFLAAVSPDERAALAITLSAYVIRIIRKPPVWGSSDAADLPALVDTMLCRSHDTLTNLRTVWFYRLGGVEPLLIYLHMAVVKALHLRITETGWEFITLVVGTANVFMGFLFVREVAGVLAGLAAACLVSVCSLDIIQSRHFGAPWMYEELCQITLLYLLLRLPRAKTGKVRFAFHAVLAIYFWTGNQMLGILPVLAYGAVAVLLERDRTEPVLPFLRRCFLGLSLLIPVASMAWLCHVTFVLHQGHLYHALYQKRHILGVYVDHWFADIHSDIGWGATWFGLAAVLVATVSERRLFSTKRLPVVLFVAYASPFWFVIPPGGTLTRGYISYGVTALLLVLSMGMVLAEAKRVVQIAFPACAVLMLAVSAGQSAYHLYASPLITAQGFQGSYTPNNGVKTAALWVRNRPRTSGRVFSDAWGGGGLEPQLMQMYFRRPYYAMSDAQPATLPYESFKRSASLIDYLVVLPANRGLVTRYFGATFKEGLRVTEDGKEVLLVYARAETVGAVQKMEVSQGDREFERKYSMLCGE